MQTSKGLPTFVAYLMRLHIYEHTSTARRSLRHQATQLTGAYGLSGGVLLRRQAKLAAQTGGLYLLGSLRREAARASLCMALLAHIRLALRGMREKRLLRRIHLRLRQWLVAIMLIAIIGRLIVGRMPVRARLRHSVHSQAICGRLGCDCSSAAPPALQPLAAGKSEHSSRPVCNVSYLPLTLR